MPSVLHPAEETFVVAGATDEWLKKCENALRTSGDFRDVESSPTLCRVTAKFRHPPVWGELTITLTPEATDSTRITAKATTTLNLYTLLFSPDRRILDDFAEAILE